MPEIRVLVVDDHPLMREALCAAIDDEADLTVVGQARDGREAVAQAQALRPDVIVLDLLLPGLDGIEATAAICAENPDARILALTSSTQEGKFTAAVQAGVLGYLLKDAERGQLLQAIREISRGTPYFPPAFARKLLATVRRIPTPEGGPPRPAESAVCRPQAESISLPTTSTPQPAASAPVEAALPVCRLQALTAREQEVLKLMSEGASNREIAAALNLSEGTVRTHVRHILHKLGLANRTQAVLYAMRQGR